MKIVWLASYPKSGNTWLRFLLHNYYYGPVHSGDDIASRIPDIHRVTGLNVNFPGDAFCKTHWALTPEHPYLNETQGVIYILRHPRDILLSSLNFRHMQEDPRSDEELALDFISNMGLPEWKQAGMGTWPEHVKSWLDKPRFPGLVLRYEDMLVDTEKSFRRVLDFLNVTVDDDQLHNAINASSFDSLRSLEEREKSAGKYGVVFSGPQRPGASELRFINTGTATPSLSHLGDNIEQQFNEKFAPILQKLGYQ